MLINSQKLSLSQGSTNSVKQQQCQQQQSYKWWFLTIKHQVLDLFTHGVVNLSKQLVFPIIIASLQAVSIVRHRIVCYVTLWVQKFAVNKIVLIDNASNCDRSSQEMDTICNLVILNLYANYAVNACMSIHLLVIWKWTASVRHHTNSTTSC